MTSTAFKITPAMRERLAKIHQRGDDDKLTPQMELELPQELEFEMGGGGLYSTAGDYLKFMRMILNRGKSGTTQVLKPETVDLMTRNNMGDSRVCLLKTALPLLSNDAEFFPGMPKTWGLSFQINTQKAPTGRPAGGLMWAGLVSQLVFLDRPDHRHRRRLPDASPPVRRQEVASALQRLRGRKALLSDPGPGRARAKSSDCGRCVQ
jgi:methyl acetate hydrolase